MYCLKGGWTGNQFFSLSDPELSTYRLAAIQNSPRKRRSRKLRVAPRGVVDCVAARGGTAK
jgi:hypothetical protein